MELKIAMVQMPVIYDALEKNLETGRNMLLKAKELGAQVAVLPECSDIGWANSNAEKLAQPVPGRVSSFYGQAARELGLYIAVGMTERFGEKLYNTAVLLNDRGEILLRHRKINLLNQVEGMVYSVGDRLGVAHTPFGCIGLDICADNLLPSAPLGQALARMGAQVILSPSAWAVRPDRDVVKEPYGQEWFVPYQKLAADYHIPVVGVSNVGQVLSGPWAGWKAIGNSIAVDSDGLVAAVLPYGEDAVCVKLVTLHLREDLLWGTELSGSFQ